MCNNNAGLSGTCISTSACSAESGESEAGHCSGAAHVQVRILGVVLLDFDVAEC